MRIHSNIEICRMVDYRKVPDHIENCQRLYFGHETCEKLLPQADALDDLLEIAEKHQLKLTFVTPFLTEKGIERVLLFLCQLKTYRLTGFEIVTPDWGLIHWVTANYEPGKLAVSRFLTGQQVDFRMMDDGNKSKDEIVCMEGIYYKLTSKQMSSMMANHFSSGTLLKEKTMEMFCRSGVTRFELSNVFQPMTLPENKQYHYSLHVPYVPLTIFRACPVNMDFNQTRKHCDTRNCFHNHQKWQYTTSNPVSTALCKTEQNEENQCLSENRELYCIDNALYYYHPNFESNLQRYKQIDRIVIHK